VEITSLQPPINEGARRPIPHGCGPGCAAAVLVSAVLVITPRESGVADVREPLPDVQAARNTARTVPRRHAEIDILAPSRDGVGRIRFG
jgi:hypothetical protein